MSDYDIYEQFDTAFEALISRNEGLETIHDGCRWAEGPVWFGDGNYLLWSDIPNDRILRYIPGAGVSEFRRPAGNTNGHTRDRAGRLVSCSHAKRCVERTEHDGTITILADRYKDKPLNSPNDVVVKSDGTVWFTDPSYGIESDLEGFKAKAMQDGCYVFCLDPASGILKVACGDFVRPNGLAFSPDETILYVADSGRTHGEENPHHIRMFKVDAHNNLSGGEVFAEIDPGIPDGLRCDTRGNVWTSAGDGIHIYNSGGNLLGKIHTPRTAANLTFGGPKKNWLFICATNAVHLVHTRANGTQAP